MGAFRSGLEIANGLGIMRQCLETRTLDQLGERLEQLESTGGTSYGTTRNTIRIDQLTPRRRPRGSAIL